MPDAESFVAAIAANPADDLPRLVFADWLDENGDPARAEFIRDHVRLAKLRPGSDEYKTLFRRCADTLRANLPAWIKPACDAFSQPAVWKPGKVMGGRFLILLQDNSHHPLWRAEFSRGFVEHVTLRMSNTKTPSELEALFRFNPITRLTAVHLPPPGYWEVLAVSGFRNVRQLAIQTDVYEGTAEYLFASPTFEGVTGLTIDTQGFAERLCRSPMAKRLTELRVPGEFQIINALHEFPLDDRLQQFTVLGGPHRSPGAKLKIGTATFLGGYISRVPFRPTLKRLDLSRCRLHDEDMARFARGEEWVRLQGLKLGGNLFGDRGWADFCRGWRTPELTYLDASRNRLTDAGTEMLARSGMLKTLRVIDLRGNRIAGRGVVALARAVAEGKLTKLLLAGNPLHKREAATVKGLLGERVDLG